MIVEEVCVDNYNGQHQRNICNIKKLISRLLETEFINCSNMVKKVVITNNLCLTMRRHGYEGLNENANATTCKVKDGYDIVINYDNAIFGEECKLIADIDNYLYHEMQHVSDHKNYDNFIELYINKNQIDNNIAYLGRRFFFEFNAAYRAQSYFQIQWEFNKYGLDENIQKYRKGLNKIKQLIENFPMDNKVEIEMASQEIGISAYEFTKRLMYDLAIACGTNAADNEKIYGRKYVNIQIAGIDSQMDLILNNFICGINEVILSNKEILKYSFANCMCVFECIKDMLIKKVQGV